MLADVLSHLHAGLKNGFFFEAVRGIIGTSFSDYSAMRKKAGFTTWDANELADTLKEEGFAAERLPKNFGLTSHRVTFAARREH